ncbi:hypothetical protein TNCV_1222771 [Trichonephila clavipes]|nr:hypothetical protein TNCV_1222771 [Trichonephila clavipes]
MGMMTSNQGRSYRRINHNNDTGPRSLGAPKSECSGRALARSAKRASQKMVSMGFRSRDLVAYSILRISSVDQPSPVWKNVNAHTDEMNSYCSFDNSHTEFSKNSFLNLRVFKIPS